MTEAETVNPHKRGGIRRVIHALWNSLQGMGAALKHESAFRQELILAVLLIPLALYLPVGLLGAALMIASMFLVLIVELMNSAVEWVVDYISLETHPFAKRAKDMASGAVFLSLMNAGIVWALILAHHWAAVREQFDGLFARF